MMNETWQPTEQEGDMIHRYLMQGPVAVRIKQLREIDFIDNVSLEVGKPVLYHVDGEWYPLEALEVIEL
jgi:hypothetical protein